MIFLFFFLTGEWKTKDPEHSCKHAIILLPASVMLVTRLHAMQAAARYSSPVSVGPGGGRGNNHRMGAAHRQRRCGVVAVPLPVPPGGGAGEKWTSPRVKNRRPPCCQFPAPPPPPSPLHAVHASQSWAANGPVQVQRAAASAGHHSRDGVLLCVPGRWA